MKIILLIVTTSLVVVFLFVIGKYQFFNVAMTHANYGMRAICNEKEIKSLYIGSSMFRLGINVVEIDSSAYLLSYNGNQPIAEELCLKYMFEKGANIKRLVVDMYPYSAANTPDISDINILQDGDISFTFDVYDAMKNHKDFSYLLKMLLNGANEVLVTWPVTHGMINSRYFRGSFTTILLGATKEKLNAVELNFEGKDTLQPLQMDALDRIIKLCMEKEIEVVFVETPKYYRVHADHAYNKMMKDYYDFLNKRNVKTILCDKTMENLGLDSEYHNHIAYSFDNNDASNFSDLIHMSGKGRDEFSRQLGLLLENIKFASHTQSMGLNLGLKLI